MRASKWSAVSRDRRLQEKVLAWQRRSHEAKCRHQDETERTDSQLRADPADVAELEPASTQLAEQAQEFTKATLAVLHSLMDEREFGRARHMAERLERELVRFATRLPVYGHRRTVLDAVRGHQATVFIAETGSGKSTQIMPYLAEAGIIPDHLMIACTQPRKVAAHSLATFVAKEWGCEVGEAVGVLVGGWRAISRQTRMVYASERSLLTVLIKDPMLADYGCVIVDEAHERNCNTDLLLGMLKAICRERPDFRVVVASATIDPEVFMKHFGAEASALVRIPGRAYPVRHIFMATPTRLFWKTVDCAIQKTRELLDDEEGVGDILVFLPCPDDVDSAVRRLTQESRDAVLVLPLHGRLAPEDSQKVLERTPEGMRKVIFATNVAEVGVTIDGVMHVVDTGLEKIAVYDSTRDVTVLKLDWTTKASVRQRSGRVGRTAPGTVHHLYSEQQLERLDPAGQAEMLRTELFPAVLQLKELGIRDLAGFDFVEHPGRWRLQQGETGLERLGFLGKDGRVTRQGKMCMSLAIDCRLARMLLSATSHRVLHLVLPLAGVLSSTAPLFLRKDSKDGVARQAGRKLFSSSDGDTITAIQAFAAWSAVPNKERQEWCQERSLVAKVLYGAAAFVKRIEGWLWLRPDLFSEEIAALRSAVGDEYVLEWFKSKSSARPADLEGDINRASALVNRCFVDAYCDNICAPDGPDLRLVKDLDAFFVDEDSDDDMDDLCIICFASLEGRREVLTLDCRHRFHVKCLDRWLSKAHASSRGCPTCRTNGPVLQSRKQLASKDNTWSIHPSSSLFATMPMWNHEPEQDPSGQRQWLVCQTHLISGSPKRAYLRFVCRVDPTWPEVERVVDVQAVLNEIRTASFTLDLSKVNGDNTIEMYRTLGLLLAHDVLQGCEALIFRQRSGRRETMRIWVHQDKLEAAERYATRHLAEVLAHQDQEQQEQAREVQVRLPPIRPPPGLEREAQPDDSDSDEGDAVAEARAVDDVEPEDAVEAQADDSDSDEGDGVAEVGARFHDPNGNAGDAMADGDEVQLRAPPGLERQVQVEPPPGLELERQASIPPEAAEAEAEAEDSEDSEGASVEDHEETDEDVLTDEEA